jgi:hypothetical protein
MGEYLSFRKHYTPGIIHVLFWVLLFANTVEALFNGHDFWGGLFTLVVGPVLIRVACELILILFEINDSLTVIRNNQASAPTAPIPAATVVEVVPPVSSNPPAGTP